MPQKATEGTVYVQEYDEVCVGVTYAPRILTEIECSCTQAQRHTQWRPVLAKIGNNNTAYEEKTGLFQLLLYGSSALYELQRQLLMADTRLRAPEQSVPENRTKNDTRHPTSCVRNN